MDTNFSLGHRSGTNPIFYYKVSESCFPWEAVRAWSYHSVNLGLAHSMTYGPDEEGKRSGLLGQKEKARERHLSQAHRAERGTCLRHTKPREVEKNTSNVFLLFQALSL
jgi:hypothetical protein